MQVIGTRSQQRPCMVHAHGHGDDVVMVMVMCDGDGWVRRGASEVWMKDDGWAATWKIKDISISLTLRRNWYNNIYTGS
jgi:hypothetical protein